MTDTTRRPRIAAAFARVRDAGTALRLAAGLSERVDYTVREIRTERGEVDLVIVEAECDEGPTCDKVETIFAGSHGVPISTEALAGEPGDYFA
jgi:hypothetical protein